MALITLCRPHQWIKNIVIFGALIFSREFTNTAKISNSLLAFAIFCLLSSAIYIFNDITDRKTDRAHPVKAKRPLASGEVTVTSATILLLILITAGIALSFLLPLDFLYTAVAFLIFNLVYSLFLKKIVIIDVMAIAASFVIRAVGGSMAITVETSSWLIACTFLLALFIGFGKRRHELTTLKDNASSHRITLSKYSPYFLDQLIGVVTASTVVAYTFYAISPEVQNKLGVDHLELTIPFVIYGIFRYLYLIHQEERGGSPTKLLLSDGPILINVLLWFFSVLAIFFYFGQ